MKYKIDGKKEAYHLPRPGDLWRHDGSANAFIRIIDSQGSAATGMSMPGYFFSVQLEDGLVVHTPVTADDIEILKFRDEILVPTKNL